MNYTHQISDFQAKTLTDCFQWGCLIVIEAGRVLDNEAIYRRIIEECAAFNGDDGVNDDAVDALTMAVSVWCYKGGGYGVKAG